MDPEHEKRLKEIEAMLIQAEEELRLELSIGNPLAKELIERLREAERQGSICPKCNYLCPVCEARRSRESYHEKGADDD